MTNKKQTSKAPKKKKKSQKPQSRWSFNRWTCLPAIILVVLYFLTALFLLPFRVMLAVSLFCTLVSGTAIICILKFVRSQKLDFLLPSLALLGIFSIFVIIDAMSIYSFVGDPLFPFWKSSLILCLPLGFLTMRLLSSNKDHLGAKILGAIVLSALLFFVIEVYTQHLNYVLDFHEPTKEVAIIEDKYESHNHKSDSYHLIMHADGEEIDLEVSFMDYDEYKIGEPYEFERYRGTFGVPFWLGYR